jgi:predicted GNAT family N-acyltransferase
MDEALIFRPMGTNEETEVCNLVISVFNEFIAPSYSQEGVNEFLKYAQPDALLYRSQKNHFVQLATAQNRIIGMIEIRDHHHVSMLFVDGLFHQKGVSRELLRRSLEICRRNKPELCEVTVNASPNSVHIYMRLGFHLTSSEQVINGIRFTPMTLELSKTGSA